MTRTTLSLAPSSLLVRFLYCLCLLFAALSQYGAIRNLLVLIVTSGRLGLMNILVAVVPGVMVGALFMLVVLRCLGVIAGLFKLHTVTRTGPIRVFRLVAIGLMAVSVLPWGISIAGVLMSRGSDSVGIALLFGNLGVGSPIAVLLFEVSRLLEREYFIDPQWGA